MRLLIGILCFSFCFHVATISVLAQKKIPKRATKLYAKANEKYKFYDFEQAKKFLNKSLKVYPKYQKAHLRLGEIHWRLGELDEAQKMYEKMLELNKSAKTTFQTHYSLARLAYEQDRYAVSIEHLTQALALEIPISDNWNKRKSNAVWLLKNCEFAQNAIKNPVPFQPVLLDSTINSQHDEYLPMVTADEEKLVYTRRFNGTGGGNEDFYYSFQEDDQWRLAKDLGNPINTASNEGAICISPDGKRLFFAAKDRKDSEGGFDIYYCYKKGEHWIGPFNIGRPVNSSKWDSQPTISANGRALYFCSRRKGGYGGIDIWVSFLKGKAWSEPINLGPNVNTAGDEQSPFIHPDNETLYFSSNGHIGMGDADLYVARKDSLGKWAAAENLGYPINTSGNENGLIVTANGERAYYSSLNMADSTGLDLYYFELPKKAKPNYVTYVKGKVFDQKTDKKTSATIELLDLETGKVILKTIADSVTGEFLVTLPAGKNYMYNVSKKGYLFHSENFSLKNHHNNEPYLLDIGLIPMIKEESLAWNVGQTVVLKNVFFETASYDLKAESHAELERLSKLLKDYPKLKIEISGHTDSIGTESYNQRLSTNRAKAVYTYLLTKGISSQKITYKGYGSAKPIATNETEEGRAANRRTAFTILEGVGNTFISKNKTGEQIVGKFLKTVSKPILSNALVPADSTKKD